MDSRLAESCRAVLCAVILLLLLLAGTVRVKSETATTAPEEAVAVVLPVRDRCSRRSTL